MANATSSHRTEPMARVYMIRHGKPSGAWGQDPDPDPGLDPAGKAQAEAAADALMALPEAERPTRVFSSPLRRPHRRGGRDRPPFRRNPIAQGAERGRARALAAPGLRRPLGRHEGRPG